MLRLSYYETSWERIGCRIGSLLYRPSGREWQLGDDRSADQIILHGYRFWAGEKPIQPALKPRLVDQLSVGRPIARWLQLVIERDQQSQLRVASW